MLFRKTQKNDVRPPIADESITTRNAPSLVSSDLSVTGDIISNGELHIEGKVEGTIRAKRLVIGEKAQVVGNVAGTHVTVQGRINGNVLANKLHLAKTASVEGNLEHNSLSIEAGATFEGKCHHVNKDIEANANGSTKPPGERKQKANEPITSV